VSRRPAASGEPARQAPPAGPPGDGALGTHLWEIAAAMSARLAAHRFHAPVAYVYDPVVYAAAPMRDYLGRARADLELLLLGMNPGPWGMAQTGVPFGAVPPVRDWLGIHGEVGRPPVEHPAKPVLGFACRRVEVSGARLWGWAAADFGSAPQFFARAFVANYCPLLFLDDGGRNLTPDQLAAADRAAITAACDEALAALLAALRPRVAVGVGAFAAGRLRAVARPAAVEQIGQVLHPSPASPAANRGWEAAMRAGLAELGVRLVGPRG
jgi:single-strand selective monofunctional uracil DNA glycosylase